MFFLAGCVTLQPLSTLTAVATLTPISVATATSPQTERVDEPKFVDGILEPVDPDPVNNFLETHGSDPGSIKDIIPFAISVADSKFFCIYNPPEKDAEGNAIEDERMFVWNNQIWLELKKDDSTEKRGFAIGPNNQIFNRNVAVWYDTSDPARKTSFTYPELFPNDLEAMTEAQRQEIILLFRPPNESDIDFLNFDRNHDWIQVRNPDFLIGKKLNPTVESSEIVEVGTTFHKIENEKINNQFPGAEVFRSPEGYTVIVNEETGLKLAGQTMETQYGDLTILNSLEHYQWQIDHIVDEHSFDRDPITNYPAELMDGEEGQELRDFINEKVQMVKQLKGYTPEGNNMIGFPELTTNENTEELMRIMSTLVELNQGKVSLNSILEHYQPGANNLIIIAEKSGRSFVLQQSLAEGLIDQNSFTTSISPVDSATKILTDPNGDSFVITSRFSAVPEPTETEAYWLIPNRYGGSMIEEPVFVMIKSVKAKLGIKDKPQFREESDGPFGPLITNLDYLNYIREYNEYKSKPMTTKSVLGMSKTITYGINKIVEIDSSKFASGN